MIRGISFDKQLLKSEDFAHQVHYFYQGKMGVSKGCNISTDIDGNLVVSDGYFSIYGRLLRNVGDTIVEVPSVASGTLYSKLVFEVDLSKENTIETFNQGQFKIVSNAATYPSLIQENLDNSGMVYQLEFCKFENTVAGITNLIDTRTILSLTEYVVKEQLQDVQKDISEINTNLPQALLDTSGWFKDPKTGCIIQWGQITISTPEPNTPYSATVTLPIPFPNRKLFQIASLNTSAPNTRFVGATYGTGLDSFLVHASTNTSAATSVDAKWMAIGC